MKNNNLPEQEYSPELKDRWETVRNVRHEFAAELDAMATDLPGKGRHQLRSLSRWFKGPAKFEDAIKRPDVLALCLPLCKSEVPSEPDSTELSGAARRGICAVGRYEAVGQHLFRLVLYPILILVAACLLWIGFSFWIAPQFREMFNEFGIELPRMTVLVLGVASLVQKWWFLSLVFPIGAAWLWGLNLIGRERRPANQTWLDQRFMSTRNALASWAWHISLLLEAGFSQSEAIQTAGTASANTRVRQLSFEATGERQLESTGQEQQLQFEPKYQLLENTMRLPESPGKIEMLREVAMYYWDRNRNNGDWWVQWLVALLLWFVLAAIVVTVIALFLPMIAIVSGLTSVK